MTGQYKVGDTVTIAKNLDVYSPGQIPFGTTIEMVALKGKKATITEVRPFVYNPENYHISVSSILDSCRYKIDIDNERWSWCNAMFEQATNFLKVVEEEL